MGSAHAALGSNVDSVAIDAQKLRALHVVQTHAALSGDIRSYSVHQMNLSRGVTVHEYVNHSGTVFAVKWQGGAQPDLQQVLGSHLSEVKEVLMARHEGFRGRHPVEVKLNNLVFRSFGRPGYFVGQAYLPKEVPNGFDAGGL